MNLGIKPLAGRRGTMDALLVIALRRGAIVTKGRGVATPPPRGAGRPRGSGRRHGRRPAPAPRCPLCQAPSRHAVPRTGTTRLLFSESAEASLASALPPGSLASRLGPGKADFAFGIRRGSRFPPWKRLPLGTRARVASPGLTRPAPSSAGTHAVRIIGHASPPPGHEMPAVASRSYSPPSP